MNMADIETALEVVGRGMSGIFAVIIVIILAVIALGKVTGKRDREE